MESTRSQLFFAFLLSKIACQAPKCLISLNPQEIQSDKSPGQNAILKVGGNFKTSILEDNEAIQ
jgi:hypothetical protein